LEKPNSIIDFSDPLPTNPPIKTVTGRNLIDDWDITPQQTPPPLTTPKEIVLTSDKGNGIQLSAAFTRRDGQVILDLTIWNQGPFPATGFAFQFNKNSFGLMPGPVQLAIPFVGPSQTGDATVSITFTPNQLTNSPMNNMIQVAMKATFQGQGDKVVYFQIPIKVSVLFVENGKLEKVEYLNTWKTISEEHFQDITLGIGNTNVDSIVQKLEANRLFFIAQRVVDSQTFIYFSAKTISNAVLLLELSLGGMGTKTCAKTHNSEWIPVLHQTVASILA